MKATSSETHHAFHDTYRSTRADIYLADAITRLVFRHSFTTLRAQHPDVILYRSKCI
jgi:hypothetical protein